MALIWLIYSLTVATSGTEAMTSYGTSLGSPTTQETTGSGLSAWTRDETDESGGRRLGDRTNVR